VLLERTGWRVAAGVIATGVLAALGTGTGSAYGAAETPAACTASQLSGAVEYEDAAAGNRYARLVLTNQGEACTLQGYPGMQLVGADGRLLGTRVYPREPEAVPPLVQLATLASAAAELHWIVGPCFTQGDDGTPDSRPVSVVVFPPGAADGLTVPWSLGYVCGEAEGPSEIGAAPFRAL
jgi:hypothetical protein